MSTDVEFVMAADEARTRLERVRALVIAAWDDVKELYRGRAWHALGYSSWEELCDVELDGAQIRVPRDEQREIVADLRDAGMSQRAIADALGIDKMMVNRDLARVSTDTPAEPVEILGKDGKSYTYTPPAPRPHVAQNSGVNEWYTPAEYVEAARAVMGVIDLDPASSDIANATVQAARYYTAEDDGLTQDWVGRVWMNPPYSQPLIGQFIERLCSQYTAGTVTQAIVLVNNGTETQWGQQLLTQASAVCLPEGRIRFLDPEGNPGAPLQGQMIAYLGDNTHGFAGYFDRFGVILRG